MTYVCYKTHRWGGRQLSRFLKLARDLRLRGEYCLVALYNGRWEVLPTEVREAADDWLCYTAEQDLLPLCKDLNYPSHWLEAHKEQGNPFWTDAAASLLPVCLYHKQCRLKGRRKGSFYWHIEDDAYYKGDWAELLEAFKNSREDLLATHICDDPEKMSWVKDTLRGYGLEDMPLRTAFMPLCRVSDRLVDELLKAYQKGAEGHFEALVPTLCAHKYGDTSIADLGDRYYTKTDPLHANVGTFGWLPKFESEEGDFRQGRIYHPVKWLCKDER
ncbi:MAG: hypothetical protein LUI09_06120, partial [Prevotellaceae bacterium]|nr:hypothetical protein [Prevotellaceae bacterium]